MPKELPKLTAKEIMAVLEKEGFISARQSGSHKIYKNAQGKRATEEVRKVSEKPAEVRKQASERFGNIPKEHEKISETHETKEERRDDERKEFENIRKELFESRVDAAAWKQVAMQMEQRWQNDVNAIEERQMALIEKLTSSREQIGELRTKLQALEAPKERVIDTNNDQQEPPSVNTQFSYTGRDSS